MIEEHDISEDSLWSSHFAGDPFEAMTVLSKSTYFDWVLVPHDVLMSKAHA